MRPLRLELEGFTVYKKPQVIDFEKLNFFVIQGKTGAGKTSIVDAITYALYGKVPRYGSARNTPSLVLSKGSRRMRVALEFSVGGKRFKIERFYREKPREDIVRVEEEGRRLDLRKSEVEQWVESITGLDYATFTRVILLPQGEFDKFIKPPRPRDRREILINLLNLEVFEKVREKASQTHKKLEGELSALRGEIDSLSPLEGENLSDIEVKIRDMSKDIEALKKSIASLEEKLRLSKTTQEKKRELESVLKRLSELELKEGDINRLEKKLELASKVLPYLPYLESFDKLHTELRDLRIEREKLLKERLKVEGELENIGEEVSKVEREYSRLPELRKKVQEKLSQIDRLGLAQRELEALEEVSRRERELREELKLRERELAEHEERLSKGESLIEKLKGELASLGYDDEEHERLLVEVERKKGLLQDKEKLEEIERSVKSLIEEEKKLEEKLSQERKLLKEKEEELERESVKLYAHHIREHLKEGDVCPVCGGEFKPQEIEEVSVDLKALKEELEALRSQVSDRELKLASLKSKIESLSSQKEELARELKPWENILKIDIESRLEELEGKKKTKKELESKLEKYQNRLNELLKGKEKVHREVEKLRSELKALEENKAQRQKSLRDIVGGEADYHAIRERISELKRVVEDIEEKVKEVESRREEIRKYKEELERTLEVLKTKAHELEKSISRKEEEKKGVSRKLAPLFEELGGIEEVRKVSLTQEEISSLEEEINNFKKDKALCETRKGELERELSELRDVPEPHEVEDKLKSLKREYEEKLHSLGELKRELEHKKEQLKRLGELKKRVEELKREIDIYSRISEDLKSNKLQEFVANLMLMRIAQRASDYFFSFTNTYELSMDEDGELRVIDRVQGTERDIKSLSGGESFLASLSFALGVSDVLSADAHLESLFIDEGFGSLDEETREKVSDMLQVIRQRINRMVGIISHLPDLAERFHQRIVVNKQGDYSTIEVFY